jgi:hypothetical protein
VAAGTTLGFVGPNGAGKSTTIKMLVGILVPSGARVRVEGRDPSRDRVAVARRIGVVFGQRTQLWWDLPLRDSFELLRHIYRVPAPDHGERLAENRQIQRGELTGPLTAIPYRADRGRTSSPTSIAIAALASRSAGAAGAAGDDRELSPETRDQSPDGTRVTGIEY